MLSTLIKDTQKEKMVKYKKDNFGNWYDFWQFVLNLIDDYELNKEEKTDDNI